MSVLDYLSDFICCLYGIPGAYGVVTMPFSVREGTAEAASKKRVCDWECKVALEQQSQSHSSFVIAKFSLE